MEHPRPEMTATQVKWLQDTHLHAQGKAMADRLNKDFLAAMAEQMKLDLLTLEKVAPPGVTLRIECLKGTERSFVRAFNKRNKSYIPRLGTMGPHFMTNWNDRLQTEHYAALTLAIERR